MPNRSRCSVLVPRTNHIFTLPNRCKDVQEQLAHFHGKDAGIAAGRALVAQRVRAMFDFWSSDQPSPTVNGEHDSVNETVGHQERDRLSNLLRLPDTSDGEL